ncbi:unnamed protein product [Moneuplotes crassus]|uniref:EF-hand domain-containing protein n=1 Tax=Euplotes crassus TaxID=5936 RepID=A0AAD1YA23_EUPCR|nr:unnamed protein product [Moneuplotes crassus]
MPSKKEALLSVMNDEEKFHAVAQKAFSDVDQDGSGKLDKSEMKNCLAIFNKDLDIPAPSDETVEKYIGILDEGDGDGMVSIDEFKILLKAMMEVNLMMIEMEEDE